MAHTTEQTWKVVRTGPIDGIPWCEMEVQLEMTEISLDSSGRPFPEGRIEKGYRLSITGVLGAYPNQGSESYVCVDGKTRRAGGFGCCHEEIAKFFPEAAPHIPHHLNDMKTGCEHQVTWDCAKQLTLTEYTWGDKYHAIRSRVEDGKCSDKEYQLYKDVREIVFSATIERHKPKHPDRLTPIQKQALTDGYLKAEKPTTATAGWTHPYEHPEGLLGKPCLTCGYQYGSAWLYQPLPVETLAWAKGGKP